MMYNPTKPYKHELLRLIESTWKTPFVKVRRGLYPILEKKFTGLEVQHTDGLGTKGVYHWRKKTFANAVVDALAMNLNDLAMVGAMPYALQDHIVTPEAGDEAIQKIMRSLVKECRRWGIAIVGGETSHHNTLEGIDISITVSGFMEKLRTNSFLPGDVLLGLRSNGLHANGFTKVRSLFGSAEWRDDFVVPTAIYLDKILNVLKRHQVHGMMHITGGAFSKLRDVLHGADAILSPPKGLMPHNIFYELHERGVSSRAMYTTFNCGIGFIISLPQKEVSKVLPLLGEAGVLGSVTRGTGRIYIKSAFGRGTVVL